MCACMCMHARVHACHLPVCTRGCCLDLASCAGLQRSIEDDIGPCAQLLVHWAGGTGHTIVLSQLQRQAQRRAGERNQLGGQTASGPAQSYTAQPSPNPVQSSPVQPSPVQPSPAQAYLVQASPGLSSPVLSSPIQSYPAQSSPIQESAEDGASE